MKIIIEYIYRHMEAQMVLMRAERKKEIDRVAQACITRKYK